MLSDKICTAAEAVRRIPRGRRILIGSGAAEPVRLVEALVTDGDHLADNDIVHLLTLGPAPYVRPELADRFRHTAFFIGSNVREAVQEGRADFIPIFLSEIPQLIRTRRCPIDVALIQVSPPDAHGFVSLGVSVDIVRAAVDSAAMILAEVNPRMPRTHGDSFLHVSKIDRLVMVDDPLLEHHADPLSDVEREIGRHVASLVPNGATIQTGIGQIPDAVLAALGDHQDLGVHTEMLSDGVMRLVRARVITGRKKTLLPGKLVTSFLMGSRALYEWAHENPEVEMRPSEFTNSPTVIARNDDMISINSALGVDFTGQVAADTLLGKFFSGIGGQVDFVRGAVMSKGGKAIIALPSTAKKGQVSRIRPAFEEGAGIVTSRGDVRYVVTEYGVASLWGKTIRERTMSLIEIAHPDHRADLLAAAKGRRYVFADQIAPRNVPWREQRKEKLRSGEEIVVRPARTSDEEGMQRLLYQLSEQSLYLRYLAHKKIHPHEETQRLVDCDFEKTTTLVVTPANSDEIIGSCRYEVDPATGLGDIAFVVRDDWQGKGVGSLLLKRAAEIAKTCGIPGFQADILAANKLMLLVFYESGLKLESKLDGDSYHVEARW